MYDYSRVSRTTVVEGLSSRRVAFCSTDRWPRIGVTNWTRRRRAGRRGGCPVLTVSLNGGGGRELVPARSDAVLAGDDDRVSSQVFRPRNDISGFYPHRVMPHNAAASIKRRAVASLSLSLSLLSPSSRISLESLAFRVFSWWKDRRVSRSRLSTSAFEGITERSREIANTE